MFHFIPKSYAATRKRRPALRPVGTVNLGSSPAGSTQSNASLHVTPRTELVGEVNGRVSVRNGVAPVGTESRGRAQAGVAYTRGHLRYDAGVFAGLTPIDPSFGVSAGVSVLFHAFSP